MISFEGSRILHLLKFHWSGAFLQALPSRHTCINCMAIQYLVVAGDEQVEEGDDGALKLGAARRGDGVRAEGLPDDGLADVGGDEQADAGAQAVSAAMHSKRA